jgi:hypothetical protein
MQNIVEFVNYYYQVPLVFFYPTKNLIYHSSFFLLRKMQILVSQNEQKKYKF